MDKAVRFNAAQLLDQTSIGIIALDCDNVIQRVNTAAEKILDRPRQHLLHTPLEKVLPGHPVALDLISRASNLLMPCRFRVAQLSPSPDINLLVSLTATPYMREDGQLQGTILEMEEVGSAEQLEEGRRLNETLDSLGSLALAVAHEVKNPLAGIRGAAQLLEMESTSETGAICTELIRSEVDRISRLLDSLLGLAEDHPINQKNINIHEVLDHVVRLCSSSGAHLVRDYDPSLPEISGDRDKLIQLFLNLISNATEATGKEGEVRISSRISKQIRLTQGRRQQHIVVEIRDNGPGIPHELRKRIFLPFVTTKSNGTGLGLAISQKIVHDHDGQMALESRPGETAFRVFLPLKTIR
ncbi:signal transduction histidine kinase, nitrogen specific, NtrB [Magnetococcus marinus MC-1]|uniref:histidine kinase n=1 Tax=Magnetococcus marinus (strain ATCC BAA-1437 / JCM 17883 / MC-1) TaxID=156889 RepID=A0LDW3_MAGMM|nr:ATP-binding protein [Magnetococcus marinus]ABK46156.1 signal transduction histidine kinase, nitrogen specific, NtrB [Magnetococcus marinus MC-1]